MGRIFSTIGAGTAMFLSIGSGVLCVLSLALGVVEVTIAFAVIAALLAWVGFAADRGLHGTR